ncbi:MAG: cysteine peptidase family C39 domain-containing protein [Caldilineaceae bacterium]
MVLDYLGVMVEYDDLTRRLGTTDRGTPFPNIAHLTTLGLFVEVAQYGDPKVFEQNIEWGLPVIVGVKTLNWQHWGNIITDHAVVVVGIDQDNDKIYIHDPFFADAPIEMSLVEFESGWIERDQQYAVIRLTPTEE